MKKMLLLILLAFAGMSTLSAQIKYVGAEKIREIKKGKGQEFAKPFNKIGDYYFVQFAVYPYDKIPDPYILGAPPIDDGEVWLIYHAGTQIKAKFGAYYIVKPFITPDLARAAVAKYEKKGISCWYNKELTSATFDLMGIALD